MDTDEHIFTLMSNINIFEVNPRPKNQAVVTAVFINDIVAVAGIKQIGVVTRAAFKGVVAPTTAENIVMAQYRELVVARAAKQLKGCR